MEYKVFVIKIKQQKSDQLSDLHFLTDCIEIGPYNYNLSPSDVLKQSMICYGNKLWV